MSSDEGIFRKPGTDEGTATAVLGTIGRLEPFEDKPRAATVLDVDSAKVVAFEFAEGQELKDHAAHHAIIVQVLRGRVEFRVASSTGTDETMELGPGDSVHLTPQLRHAVRAVEPTTLTVTMLQAAG